ncbi:putative Secreted Protein [Cryptosporidium tyzzeri]|nr:putative Secreted Protein [Cryptosporidium tyzzeri]
MFIKKSILIFFILIFLICQTQGISNDLSSLTSNLVSKYMTKEEFLGECKRELPKFRSNLTETQVYFLCLKALKSSLDKIYNNPAGKLLNSDSVPKDVVEHKTENDNVEGYRKLLDDVSNIFSSDVYFDEDLLEADNGLFSNSIQTLLEIDKKELKRKEFMEKKVKEIQNTEERLREEYREKLKKKYPEAYHPLALEIFSTISKEDIETWMNLPLKLKLPVINYYFLLVATMGQSSEKGDRHKIFTKAIISTIISKNEIKIPKYMTLQDIRYEICKFGMIHKSGCNLVPFSTLLSLPRHSFEIWKSFGLVLQFEFLIAMTYSIEHEMNFDDCDKEIFKITNEKKLRKEDESKIQVYLSHLFPEEDSLPLKHFKNVLKYLLDIAVNDEPSKLDDQSQSYSVVSSNFAQEKNYQTSSIQVNQSESINLEPAKETKIENEVNDKIENQEKKVTSFFDEVKDVSTIDSEKVEINKNEYSSREYLTLNNDTDNIIEVAKLEEIRKIKDNSIKKSTVDNKNKEEFNLISLLNSEIKARDAKITMESEKSNGLKKIDVGGLNSLPPNEYNPYSNVGIGSGLMNEEEDDSFPEEEEKPELGDESNDDLGQENIESHEGDNMENEDNGENTDAEELGDEGKKDDLDTRQDELDEGDSGNGEDPGLNGEGGDENDNKDDTDGNDQDGNNEEDTPDGGDIGGTDQEDSDSGDGEGGGGEDNDEVDDGDDGEDNDEGEDGESNSGDGGESGSGESNGEREDEESISGDGGFGGDDGEDGGGDNEGEDEESNSGDGRGGEDNDGEDRESNSEDEGYRGDDGGDNDEREDGESNSGDGGESGSGESNGEREDEESISGDGGFGGDDGGDGGGDNEGEDEESNSGDGGGEEEGDSDSGGYGGDKDEESGDLDPDSGDGGNDGGDKDGEGGNLDSDLEDGGDDVEGGGGGGEGEEGDLDSGGDDGDYMGDRNKDSDLGDGAEVDGGGDYRRDGDKDSDLGSAEGVGSFGTKGRSEGDDFDRDLDSNSMEAGGISQNFGGGNTNQNDLEYSTGNTRSGGLENNEFERDPLSGSGGKGGFDDSYSSLVGNNDKGGGFGKEVPSFDLETGNNLNSGDSNPFGNSSFKSLNNLDSNDFETASEKGIDLPIEDKIRNDIDDLDSTFNGLNTPIDSFDNSGLGSKENLELDGILASNQEFNDNDDMEIAERLPTVDQLSLGIEEGNETGEPTIVSELDFGNGKEVKDLDKSLEKLKDSLGGSTVDNAGVDDLFGNGINKSNSLGINKNEILGGEDFGNEVKFGQGDTSDEVDNLLNEFQEGNNLNIENNYDELNNIQGTKAIDIQPNNTDNFLDSLLISGNTGDVEIEINPMSGDNKNINSELELLNNVGTPGFDIDKNPSLFEMDNDAYGRINEAEIDKDLDKVASNLQISNNEINFGPNDSFEIQNKNLETELEELTMLGDPGTEVPGINLDFPDNSVLPETVGLNDEFKVLEDLSADGPLEEDEFEFLERILNKKGANRDFKFASTVDSEEFTDEEEFDELNLPNGQLSVGYGINSQIPLSTQNQTQSEKVEPSVLPDDQLSLVINSIPGADDNSAIEINEVLIRDPGALDSIYEDLNDVINDLDQNTSFPVEMPEIDQTDTIRTNSDQAIDNNISNIYSDFIENDKESKNINTIDGSLDIALTENSGGNIENGNDYIGNFDILIGENNIPDQGFEDDFGLEGLFKEGNIDKQFDQSEFIPFLDELEKENSLSKNKKASSNIDDIELVNSDLFGLNSGIETKSDKTLSIGDPEESISTLFENDGQYNSAVENDKNLDIFEIQPGTTVKDGEIDSVLNDLINNGGISTDSSLDEFGLDFDKMIENNQEKNFQNDDMYISTLFVEPEINLGKNEIENNLLILDFDKNKPNSLEPLSEDDNLYLDQLFKIEGKKNEDFGVNNNILLDKMTNNEKAQANDEEINLSEIEWLNERDIENNKKIDETNLIIEDLYRLFEMNGNSEGNLIFKDEFVLNDNEIKSLNSLEDTDDLKLDEFFDREVDLNQYNTNNMTSAKKRKKRKKIKKKNKNKKERGISPTEEYEISSEELDFLFDQSDKDSDQTLNKLITESTDNAEFVDSDDFLNMGNIQVKKSTLVRVNKLDSDDIHYKKRSRLVSDDEEIETDKQKSMKKMLRGAFSEEYKEPRPTNRSIGTILEKQKGRSEKEWIMSFAPKLRPGRMQRRRDLFSEEEIQEAIKEARLA